MSDRLSPINPRKNNFMSETKGIEEASSDTEDSEIILKLDFNSLGGLLAHYTMKQPL